MNHCRARESSAAVKEQRLTHEGSNVADQAEQATFRRVGATFTAAQRHDRAVSVRGTRGVFTCIFHSVRLHAQFSRAAVKARLGH